MAKEKTAVDQQTQDIHQKFRKNKINKEFGQLSGEELFKPLTKRLDEKSSTTTQEVEEIPDYAMDEFDRTNPFGDEFRPDAPTPAPSPPPSPSPPPYDDDGDDFPLPPPPLMEETSKRKEWAKPGPVEPEYHHQSALLQTVNQLITKYGDDPNYKVKSKKTPLHGYSVEELKKIRDGINEKRRATQPLSKKLEQGKQSLKPTPPRKSKESLPPTSFEKKIMSRRPAVEPSDDEEDFPEQDWETEGSGIASEADKLINQLYLNYESNYLDSAQSTKSKRKKLFAII